MTLFARSRAAPIVVATQADDVAKSEVSFRHNLTSRSAASQRKRGDINLTSVAEALSTG
jgi:hypothetical protein